jgi:hypothetical protein
MEYCNGKAVPVHFMKWDYSTDLLRLNLATKWNSAVIFISQPLYPRERNPYPQHINWMGSSVCLCALERRIIFYPKGIINPDRPTRSLIAILSTLHRFLLYS